MTSPYMNTREIAIYLRFVDAETGAPNVRLAHEYLTRHAVRCLKRGRICLYRREDIEATLQVRAS